MSTKTKKNPKGAGANRLPEGEKRKSVRLFPKEKYLTDKKKVKLAIQHVTPIFEEFILGLA